MIYPDLVGTLQAMEPKLPLIYRKDIRAAITEIVSLREQLKAVEQHHLPDYPERQ
jgi:hypothetical protein